MGAVCVLLVIAGEVLVENVFVCGRVCRGTLIVLLGSRFATYQQTRADNLAPI
jgi:hypothetical protein